MANGEIFDVTVIGTGPGGYVAAIRAAQMGLQDGRRRARSRRAAAAPASCAAASRPRRSSHTADLYEDLKNARSTGSWRTDVGHRLRGADDAGRRASSRRLSKGIEGYLFKKNKITLFKGQAGSKGPRRRRRQGRRRRDEGRHEERAPRHRLAAREPARHHASTARPIITSDEILRAQGDPDEPRRDRRRRRRDGVRVGLRPLRLRGDGHRAAAPRPAARGRGDLERGRQAARPSR